MKALKQFRFVTNLFAILTVLLLSISACHRPCAVPNPLIEFNVAPDTFAVTPGHVLQTQTVKITAFDALGTHKGDFTVEPGQQQRMHFDTSAHRPIQLIFVYQSGTGDTLAKDSILINDIAKKGVTLPDMDIVIGRLAPGNHTCPTATAITPAISIGTHSTKKATFTWAANDSFEVTLTCGNTVKKFRLTPQLGDTPDKSGQLLIFNGSSYQCLNLVDSDMEPESKYAMIITAISDFCSIRASNDGTTKTISITYPDTCTIVVKK